MRCSAQDLDAAVAAYKHRCGWTRVPSRASETACGAFHGRLYLDFDALKRELAS